MLYEGLDYNHHHACHVTAWLSELGLWKSKSFKESKTQEKYSERIELNKQGIHSTPLYQGLRTKFEMDSKYLEAFSKCSLNFDYESTLRRVAVAQAVVFETLELGSWLDDEYDVRVGS
ncbi:hypothetical protein AVEN_193145-1 [Araneus ventricosus]|uniref:Uncharacterized protein n=1 Tax=Araneus ventricosus TaxID=182803 RepID=A0A4Y2B0P4_ARAVE|nr:hypothetical protein AVEN_193145-1 [Araneus ventricosus]